MDSVIRQTLSALALSVLASASLPALAQEPHAVRYEKYLPPLKSAK